MSFRKKIRTNQYQVASLNDLVKIQKDGRNFMSTEDLYVEESGEFSAMLQQKWNEINTEAAIMLTYTNEIWEIINEKKQDMLEKKNPGKAVKDYFIERFADNSSPLKILTQKDIPSEKVDFLIRSIENIYTSTIKKNSDSEELNGKIKNFAKEHLFDGTYIEPLTSLVSRRTVTEYVKGNRQFRSGQVEEIAGEKIRKIGWNELQHEANHLYQKALDDYAASEKKVTVNGQNLLFISERFPEQYKKIMGNLKSRNLVSDDISKLIKDNRQNLQTMLELKYVVNSIDKYRDEGIKFDLQILKPITNHLEEKYKQKCLPEAFYDPLDPHIEFFNKQLGVLNEVKFYEKGAKSEYSTKRKVAQDKYYGDASSIGDMARNTFAIGKMSGSGFFTECQQIIFEREKYPYHLEGWKSSRACYLSKKVNAAITINYKGKNYIRICENKVVPVNQMEVKDPAQMLYNSRRVILPENSAGGQLLNVDNPHNKAQLEEGFFLYEKSMSDARINNLAQAHNIKTDMDKQTFAGSQANLNSVYKSMEFLETQLFLEAVSHSDKSIIGNTYFTIKKQKMRDDLKGKTVLCDETLKLLDNAILNRNDGHKLLLGFEEKWEKMEKGLAKDYALEKAGINVKTGRIK